MAEKEKTDEKPKTESWGTEDPKIREDRALSRNEERKKKELNEE